MEKLIAKYAEYAIYEAGRESIEALSPRVAGDA